MTKSDIVAELDHWLDNNATAITITSWAMIKRARDEIVALRELTDGNWVWQQITSTRAEARREGADEMRERLIEELHEWARDRCFIDIADPADWARVMRELSLAPEEPT